MPNMHTCMNVLFERSQRNTRVLRIRALFCKVEFIISFDARVSDRSLSIVLKL